MAEIDLERVRAVLVQATGPGGGYSQRSLSKAAGEGRDLVADIIKGRNKNPTLSVLNNLAKALSGDLSLFGVTPPQSALEPPTAGDLESAIREALPSMPRGSLDKRARFLAEAVARALRLPPSRLAIADVRGSLAADGHEEVAPLREATN